MNNTIKQIQEEVSGIEGIFMLLFGIYGVFSHHFLLCLLSGFVLIVLIKALWKPYVPPVMLFFLTFHWVQIFACILYADFQGATLDVAYESKDTEFLFFMTLLQIMIMGIVAGRYLQRIDNSSLGLERLQKYAEQINVKNVIICYVASIVVIPVLISVSRVSPSLYQLAQTLNSVKTLFVAVLVFVLLLTKTKANRIILGIVIFDFVLSFASFFSDFKETLFLIIIVYFTVYPVIKSRVIVRIAPAFILIFIFFSFWSYIKGDYRQFLNQGSKMQEVNVSNTEALMYIFDQFGETDMNAIQEGGKIFLSRIQYMERYTEVYNRVPSQIDHQEGADMIESLKFLLIPRFLNPDKGVKDASIRTSYYTGRIFSSAVKGTSISMGYFCDLYIDFGLYFMFIPLLLIIAMLGYIMKYILIKPGYNPLFTFSLLIGIFLSLGTFESDTIFFLGTVRNNIALLVLGYVYLFPKIEKYITEK